MLSLKRKRGVLLLSLIVGIVVTLVFVPTFIPTLKLSLFYPEEVLVEAGNVEVTTNDILIIFSIFAGAASLAAFIIIYIPTIVNKLPSMGLRKKH